MGWNPFKKSVPTSDRVILIVGASGCGKTEFIKKLCGHGNPDPKLSGGTKSIKAYVRQDASSSTRLVLVDTPPINKEESLDKLTAMDIQKWIRDHKIKSISGVVYLFDIRTKKLKKEAHPHKLIDELLPFCGGTVSKSSDEKKSIMALLTMTYVDAVRNPTNLVEYQANAEYLATNWKDSLPGSRIATGSSDYMNTPDSAWDVLSTLLAAQRPIVSR